MISYNRVILTGKVMTSPRLQYRPDGSPVIQFPLELNDSEHQPSPTGRTLINIVAIGKLAEFKFELLQSGQQLLVKGRLNQRCWQTPEGRKRTRIEVIATDLQAVEEMNRTGKSKDKGEEDEKTC
jgi:single-strand DNA-binding protein